MKTSSKDDLAKYREVAYILQMSPVERVVMGRPVTLQEISDEFHVSLVKVREIKNNLEYYLIPQHVLDKKVVLKYDSKAYLESRSQEVDDNLLKACKKLSPSALKVYYQILGKLIEKSETEVKIGLTADELARRNLEAERRVNDVGRGAGHRVESVPEKLPLLPDQVCESEG